MFQRLRHSFTLWLVRLALTSLTKLSVEAINQLPWYQYGLDINKLTDQKFSKPLADQVQNAVADGLTAMAKALKA